MFHSYVVIHGNSSTFFYDYYVVSNWKYFSITCSFNLGDGGVILESNETALNVWHTVEIQRNGRQGTLVVNGAIEAKVWWMKSLYK